MPIQYVPTGASGESGEHQDAANVPKQEHYRDILWMKEPQRKIRQTGCRQRTEASRQPRREWSAVTQHQQDEYRRHGAGQSDKRKTSQIMFQVQRLGAKASQAMYAAFPNCSQPCSQWNEEYRQKASVVPGNNCGKSCHSGPNTNGQS